MVEQKEPNFRLFRGNTVVKEKLAAILGSDSVFCQQPLAKYTSFGVGGPAEYLVRPREYSQVASTVAFCTKNGVPLRVLGRGTNLLISDKGLPGVVMLLADNLAKIDVAGASITAQAGASLMRVSSLALVNNLSGLEFASGIPGSVGGAVVMNAGAYGGEMKQVLQQVLTVDSQGNLSSCPLAEMELGYRASSFQHNGRIVLEGVLKLLPGDAGEIQRRMNELTRRRREKQPLDKPSAGSTFKRPPGQYAGQLIEASNLKGLTLGGAAVSPKHCGFIINAGGATAQDIYDLISKVQTEVQKQQGVFLVPEVQIWGEFN